NLLQDLLARVGYFDSFNSFECIWLSDRIGRLRRLRLQARNDLARDNLDLIASVLIRHEDDLLDTDREMLLELGNAFVDRAHDRAFPRAIALGREVPFLVQPLEHVGPYRFLRLADHDRQL